MSMVPTWVRARDGALYKNPMLEFKGGFICFDDSEPPEIVLWKPARDVRAVLRDVLGPEGWYVMSRGRSSERVVPRTKPWEFKAATAFFFHLGRRIPRPTQHEGTARYSNRIGECCIFDPPSHPRDAYELNLPMRMAQ